MSARFLAHEMTGYVDFGIGHKSPELPNGVRAELFFPLEWAGEGLIADDDEVKIVLTDEDGEPIEINPLLLPLIREALVARTFIRSKGKASPREQMMDYAYEVNR